MKHMYACKALERNLFQKNRKGQASYTCPNREMGMWLDPVAVSQIFPKLEVWATPVAASLQVGSLIWSAETHVRSKSSRQQNRNLHDYI